MTGLAARWREVLIGVALGALGYGTALLFPASWRVIIEGALVAWIGAIYIGFGLASAGTRPAVIEVLGAVAMLFLAVVGITSTPWLLTAALVLHAAWDFAHHGLKARYARMERTNRTQSLRVLRVGTARRGGGY